MSFPADWIVPDWPAPRNVRAICTSRAGGVSIAPYDSLNLGDHVGDDPAAVRRNRQVFNDALGARPVFLAQVHGVKTASLSPETPDGTTADGCVTGHRGVACTIMVADCLPVLLTDVRGTAVGAAHAGWRGLAEGVIEAAVTAMPRGERMAWLGPCIGPDAFEVGAEVRDAFVSRDASAAQYFKTHGEGKFLADLPGLARQRLQALGVTAIYGNDSSTPWCTVSNPSRFFSHRRDRVSGRLAASVWLA
ncbi:peptidoglycan editing factor PgeF [Ramlibacter sp. WS9]|uniref:peptidoglycan editing factor PgeF n=1 Tax=Ramlibacter sp. WS9 TaxID=1882741 RepID=UPI0011432F9A|nr:peptidoglycan editing factor PgeF [Ramlibacter sp. WS9]ROZ72400.1 peptidoglycan editing factor PgeF [Ramlibacter sp. WS9]